jgi:hypothetical protein
MTLEQLKELKEKSDKLVETLQNDRVLMKNTVNKIKEDNSKDFQEFLDSLKEYAKLIPDDRSYDNIGTIKLFGKFDKHAHGGFWGDDTWMCVYNKQFYFLCANSDEEYTIYISEERAICSYPKEHHSYSHIYFDDFKKFILEHKEEFRAYVEEALEDAINCYVARNKAENDSLFQRAEELNRE